ncbi:HypC/HybG/HupF family hydrogenase formation chaperone [Sulfurisphaera ohwakuensis]|uniref:Hydrogenase expression/formation protein HypC n=1 Tax=Sulfurisphaera ohwakuensis TaxID=69656 RepID=A0A650CFT8_SULOH|nr:HypC/HybG/HupF family hydrogenase formation chaperone [Sulfurisphaera ohwakuensis]MBB5254476.1 hydrogenase expression/formation protein HypC [Sulfurisphaera ohwakuensis]QGR16720.1 hydrogenase maturation factor [Sulfurisphaera ohwakuensis]
MCISLPAKVVQIEGMIAFVDYGNGVIEPVINNVDDVKEGDYVVVSYGMIVSKISEEEFKEMIEYEIEMRRLLSSSPQ